MNRPLLRISDTITQCSGFKIQANGAADAPKNNGQLARIESFIGANKQSQQRFEYDSIGRLSESSEYRGDNGSLTYKQKFDFDRFGNLYRKAASNPTSGQASPLPFTPIEDSDISKSTNRFTTSTTYDDAGNVVVDNKFRTMGFAYDANGRQVKATRSGALDAWTVYDALGNRVATKINDVWQYMVYDAFGKLVAEYGQLSDGLGGVKYIQQDWQGSVRAVTNNNGFVVARTDHQAFGEEIGFGVGLRSIEQGYSVDKIARQGYGLTERDDATGLDHTWFRKNENRAGRWTSPDPYKGSMSLGNPQSFNRYSYVENQPTNFVDPSGLESWSLECTYIGYLADAPGFPRVYSCRWIRGFGGGGGGGPTQNNGRGGGGGGGGGKDDEKLDMDILNLCLEALYKEKGKTLKADLVTLPAHDTESKGTEPRFIGGSMVLSNTNFRRNSSSRNEEFMSAFRGEINTVVRLNIGNGDIGGTILPSSSSNLNIRPVDFIADPIAATLSALGAALSSSGIGDRNRTPYALWDCYRTNRELREKLKK